MKWLDKPKRFSLIQACAARMPKDKPIQRMRADSAAYQTGIFNGCEEHAITFAIGADADVAVKAAIAAIPAEAWRPPPRRRDRLDRAQHEQNAEGV